MDTFFPISRPSFSVSRKSGEERRTWFEDSSDRHSWDKAMIGSASLWSFSEHLHSLAQSNQAHGGAPPPPPPGQGGPNPPSPGSFSRLPQTSTSISPRGQSRDFSENGSSQPVRWLHQKAHDLSENSLRRRYVVAIDCHWPLVEGIVLYYSYQGQRQHFLDPRKNGNQHPGAEELWSRLPYRSQHCSMFSRSHAHSPATWPPFCLGLSAWAGRKRREKGKKDKGTD